MTVLKYVPLILLIVLCFMIHSPEAAAEEKWPGVDKTVVEKFAGEHGRRPVRSLIDTDQGDLLLFIFLIAGAAGGFAAGYYWRVLTERKAEKRSINGAHTG